MSKQFKQYTTDANEDGSINIRAVPVFELGKHKGFDYNQEWAEKALANFETQKTDDYFPPVIIGHNNGDEEKPAKGFMDNLALDGDIVITDITKVPEATFGKLQDREYPNRSLEVNPEKATITALALLGGTTPHFKLPIMEFGADPDGVVIDFAEEIDLKAAIDIEKKLDDVRDIWWKAMDFIHNTMSNTDKTEEEKKSEVKSLLEQGVEILGEAAKNFKINKQGEQIMAENKKVFTEEELNNAKNAGFDEKFQKKFGKTYDEYMKDSEAEVSKAKDARIKAFADKLKTRNIAPAIIDDMIVPFMEVVPSDKKTTVKFKEGDKETEVVALDALEQIFEKLFELDEKGSLVVDFSEKAKTKGGKTVEEQFGEEDEAKIHEKAVEIAEEKSGQFEGEKFNEEYNKAVFELKREKK